MSTIAMPAPDASILSRKDQIVAALAEAIGAEDVISDPVETRAYECDALTAYRCPPLSAKWRRTRAFAWRHKAGEPRSIVGP